MEGFSNVGGTSLVKWGGYLALMWRDFGSSVKEFLSMLRKHHLFSAGISCSNAEVVQ